MGCPLPSGTCLTHLTMNPTPPPFTRRPTHRPGIDDTPPPPPVSPTSPRPRGSPGAVRLPRSWSGDGTPRTPPPLQWATWMYAPVFGPGFLNECPPPSLVLGPSAETAGNSLCDPRPPTWRPGPFLTIPPGGGGPASGLEKGRWLTP